MPWPFVLPTTSAFSFSSSFSCNSHPSLALHASARRGVVRDTLKSHKRLPRTQRAAHLGSVVAAFDNYLPYLFAIDAGLGSRSIHGDDLDVVLRTTPMIEWRPTLSDSALPGKEPPRVKVRSLEHEMAFSLSTLAQAYTLQARAVLQPLYTTCSAPVGTSQRLTAITQATRHLLDAAAVYGYLSHRADRLSGKTDAALCADIAPSTLHALCSLCLAEATLLAVLKDDVYPAVVARDRNPHDTEWMIKAPEMPKPRAHLFARLCLAASEHAARARALCASNNNSSLAAFNNHGTTTNNNNDNTTNMRRLHESFVRYLGNLQRTSRAKACRFLGIDAELAGSRMGEAIAWLHAGLQELGVEVKRDAVTKTGGLSKWKREWSERREDKRVDCLGDWGLDAGRAEEMRVLVMLEAKWGKENDVMFHQPIPPTGPLAQLPSGREIHSLPTYHVPVLDASDLQDMRDPPDRSDDEGGRTSSGDEAALDPSGGPIGAFPGTYAEYRTQTPGAHKSGSPGGYY